MQESKSSHFSEYIFINGDQEVGKIVRGYLEIFRGREHLAPLCFSQCYWPIQKWAETRVIDSTRANSCLVKQLVGLKEMDDISTLYANHAVSLTDSYWIRTSDESLTWDQVKPNSDKLFDVALHGKIPQDLKFDPCVDITPELTNTGSFDKAWMKTKDDWVYVKSSSKYQNLAEVLISRIGKLMGMDMLEYELSEDGTCTLSKDFTKGVYNFEPASYLVDDDQDFQHNFFTFERYSIEIARQYIDILFLDAIIVNPDRHTNNYGMLRDRRTGEVIKLAPNYDNNLSDLGQLPRNRLTTIMIGELKQFLMSCRMPYYPPYLRYEELLHEVEDVYKNTDQDPKHIADMIHTNYLAFWGLN